MLKQEITSDTAILTLLDFLLSRKFKNIFLNFCYIDDDEKPSIIIGGTGNFISEGEFNQILLHPDQIKRESLEYFPFINSCFNISKKVNISGRKDKNSFAIAFENKEILNPYLDYKKTAAHEIYLDKNIKDFVLIKLSNLENIKLNNDIIDENMRKPHISFFNLMKKIKDDVSTKYYKFIKEGVNFSVSTKDTYQFLSEPLENILPPMSPFQEEDPQCQELEVLNKTLSGLKVQIKSFLISYENNPNQVINSKKHGVFFIYKKRIVFFDQWQLCSVKKRRILAKDPNKIIRIRVLLDGDINYSEIFSINPINNKIKISNSLIKLIDSQIEISLSTSLSILQNLNNEYQSELEDIARNDALAAYKELIYSKKYDKESAIKKICENGEMLKFNFIEDYLRGMKI